METLWNQLSASLFIKGFIITYIKGRMATDNEAAPEAAHGQPTLSYYSIHIVVCSGTPEISRFQLNGGTYTHKCSHGVMTVSFEWSHGQSHRKGAKYKSKGGTMCPSGSSSNRTDISSIPSSVYLSRTDDEHKTELRRRESQRERAGPWSMTGGRFKYEVFLCNGILFFFVFGKFFRTFSCLHFQN